MAQHMFKINFLAGAQVSISTSSQYSSIGLSLCVPPLLPKYPVGQRISRHQNGISSSQLHVRLLRIHRCRRSGGKTLASLSAAQDKTFVQHPSVFVQRFRKPLHIIHRNISADPCAAKTNTNPPGYQFCWYDRSVVLPAMSISSMS